jgi:cytochrome c
MDSWEWTKVGTAIGLACGVIGASTWTAGKLMAPVYPRQQGYEVAGVPPVDLGAAQRQWPTGGGLAERQQMFGYISRIGTGSVRLAAAPEAAAPAEAPVDLAVLLASAEPERGRRTAQACMACHDLSQGGPNRIGPNLWDVVDRPVASHAGFAYSAALKAQGGQWTYRTLDRFLTQPGRAVPGTKMTFAGIRNPRERANLLAFLATLGTVRHPIDKANLS